MVITSVTLSMKRIDSYSTHTLNIGSGSSGAWGASLDWNKDISVSSGTGTKTWNLTAYASILQGYTGSWYLHIKHGSGTNSYSEFSGSSPKLEVEYMLPASGPSLSSGSVDLGAGVTIYTNRTDASYTHTVSYSFGGASGVVAYSVGDSVTWYPPLSLAAQIPSTTAGTCTITCDTYYSGVLSGSKSCTLTLTVPSGVVPSISSVGITEAVSG